MPNSHVCCTPESGHVRCKRPRVNGTLCAVSLFRCPGHCCRIELLFHAPKLVQQSFEISLTFQLEHIWNGTGTNCAVQFCLEGFLAFSEDFNRLFALQLPRRFELANLRVQLAGKSIKPRPQCVDFLAHEPLHFFESLKP